MKARELFSDEVHEAMGDSRLPVYVRLPDGVEYRATGIVLDTDYPSHAQRFVLKTLVEVE